MDAARNSPADPDPVTPLRERRVLVVGAGGLGSPAALLVARGGVGRLTVIDDDVVDESNLQRQILFGLNDVGRPKAEAARRLLTAEAAPGTEIECLHARLDSHNAGALFAAHDLVLDGSDDIETKFLCSDVAMRQAVPLVHAGVIRFVGQALPIVRSGPCLRCLFEGGPASEDAPSCAQAGILGTTAGVLGTYQAMIGMALLRGEEVRPTLRMLDLKAGSSREVTIRPRSDCPVCAPLSIDITAERCPMTYVRTKLRLESLPTGAVLDVLLRGEEPLRNVPRSLQEDGHRILHLLPRVGGEAGHRLRVVKG